MTRKSPLRLPPQLPLQPDQIALSPEDRMAVGFAEAQIELAVARRETVLARLAARYGIGDGSGWQVDLQAGVLRRLPSAPPSASSETPADGVEAVVGGH